MSDTPPIQVDQSPVPTHLMSLIRDGLVAGSTWLVAQGYVDDVTGTQIVSMGVLAATVAWRQWVTHRNHKKLVTTANASPNNVARVK